MYVELWLKNTDRNKGDEITLIDPSKNDDIAKLQVDKTYKYTRQDATSADRTAVKYLRIVEVAYSIFYIEFAGYDKITDTQCTQMDILFDGKLTKFTQSAEFEAWQYAVKIGKALVGLEDLNRIFWRQIGTNYDTVEIIENNEILQSIIDLLNSKLI